MVSPAGYPTANGRRYSRAYPPYMTIPERRYHISPHDGRGITMADSQVETDSQPQRKRIAVACGRCRKRKIRCSGDPGGGMPCSNCKNAGSEPCLFLRVQSTEAPMRPDSTTDFVYNVQDARAYSNRTISHSVQYPQDLPTLSSTEILNPYRGGSPYTYGTKQFYPTMPSYGTGYTDEYVDYGLSCPTQPVLNHDHVNIVPYPWPSRTKQPSSSSMYVDPETGYAYGGTASLVHRPAHVATTDSPNFSFSSMAAHLPAASVSGSDRLLPTPVSRALSGSSGLLYPSTQTLKTATAVTVTNSSPISATGTTGEAVAAGYSSTFDTSGLPYASTATSLPGQHSNSTRTGSVTYTAGSESLFSEHEHNLRSHGSAVDLTGYAYTDSTANSIRRGSGSSSQTSSGTGAGSSLSSGQAYITSDQPDDSASQGHGNGHSHHHTHHPQQQQHQSHHNHHHSHIAAAVDSNTAATSYLSDAPGGSGPGSGHAESRRATVGGRR